MSSWERIKNWGESKGFFFFSAHTIEHDFLFPTIQCLSKTKETKTENERGKLQNI